MVSHCVENNRTDPWIIRVRVCEQRNSAPKTQCNLVCEGLSCPHSDKDRKTLTLSLLFLVVIQERFLHTHSWWHIWTLVRTHQKHEKTPSRSLFLVPRFTHAEPHDGVPRARNTNLSVLVSENMWCVKWQNDSRIRGLQHWSNRAAKELQIH